MGERKTKQARKQQHKVRDFREHGIGRPANKIYIISIYGPFCVIFVV
jgi:hypothetical protein